MCASETMGISIESMFWYHTNLCTSYNEEIQIGYIFILKSRAHFQQMFWFNYLALLIIQWKIIHAIVGITNDFEILYKWFALLSWKRSFVWLLDDCIHLVVIYLNLVYFVMTVHIDHLNQFEVFIRLFITGID